MPKEELTQSTEVKDNTPATDAEVNTPNPPNPLAPKQDTQSTQSTTQAAEGDELAKYKELVEKYKGYEEAAKKWAEHEESLKTAEQKMNEQLEALKAENEALKTQQQVQAIITKYGVKQEDAVLLGTGDIAQIEERAKRIAEIYSTRSSLVSEAVQAGNLKPGSGDAKKPVPSDYPASWVKK